VTMPTTRCPAGHETASLDYCDVCGVPVGASAGAGAPAPSPPPAPPTPKAPATPASAASAAPKRCPSCQDSNPGDALFCETCGYDFTTGQLPPPAPPRSSLDLDPAAPAAPAAPAPASPSPTAGADWMAEIWVDPAWYERNREDTTDPCPAAGAPKIVPLAGTNALIGRPSSSRQITPQVDCSPDSGVSRRHAQLLLDGEQWYVEDLGSTNGTFVAAAAGALPVDPIPSGQRRELGDNDRVYVGAWTRIVVRRSTPTERGE
jgi:hypothetical protein